jgi:hypothetical protein
MKLLRDLFFGPENQFLDLGRILAFGSALAMIAGAVWNVLLGLPLELGPTGFGGGLAAVLGGCAALIYAKDRARSENTVAKVAQFCAPAAPKRVASKSKPRKPTRRKP